jgi:uncharacterized protein YndB with AHSA1/START domain
VKSQKPAGRAVDPASAKGRRIPAKPVATASDTAVTETGSTATASAPAAPPVDPDVLASLRRRFVRVVALLDAPPERTHRAWSDPEEMASWFPKSVRGSLSVGARSELEWRNRIVPVDVLESEPPGIFRFRWHWLPDNGYPTEVTVLITRNGYGSRVSLTDGPFDLTLPGVADAFLEAAEGWGGALVNLRARVDLGSDLRPRFPY